MMAIKKAGGTLVVQQPETALVGFMPQQAILLNDVDYILDVSGLIAFLHSLNGVY